MKINKEILEQIIECESILYLLFTKGIKDKELTKIKEYRDFLWPAFFYKAGKLPEEIRNKYLAYVLPVFVYKKYKKVLNEYIPKVRLGENTKKFLEILKNQRRGNKDIELDDSWSSLENKGKKGYTPNGTSLCRKLEETNPGLEDFKKYEGIIKTILEYVFSEDIIKWDSQVKIHNNRKRIDLDGHPKGTSKFIENILGQRYQLRNNRLTVECKNYGRDIGNPEVDQINGRLTHHRQFGVIICRQLENRGNAISRCYHLINSHRVIIILDDIDIQELLLHRVKNDFNRIYEYLNERISEVYDDQDRR